MLKDSENKIQTVHEYNLYMFHKMKYKLYMNIYIILSVNQIMNKNLRVTSSYLDIRYWKIVKQVLGK